MSLSETKAMKNYTKESIYVGSQEIEYVDEYVYLRQLISPKQQMSKEVQRQITNIWSQY